MKYISFIYLLISLLFVFSESKAQEPSFSHYTTENGLSHNEVRVIRKTVDGTMWFGTQNGLTCFDGYRFRVFKTVRGDSLSLCGNKIYSLANSPDGNLWIGTTTGLCRINIYSKEISRWQDTLAIKTNLEKSFIKDLFVDAQKTLWVSASSGNYKFMPEEGKIVEILNDYDIKYFHQDKAGRLWAGSNKELLRIKAPDGSIEKKYPIRPYKMFDDRFGILWLLANNGVHKYEPTTDSFDRETSISFFEGNGFNAITDDRKGNLFLGGYGSTLSVYDRKTQLTTHYPSNPKEVNSLSSNDVYDIFSDEEGVIWIGTQEGLDVYDWTRHRFGKWQHMPDDPKGLSNNFIQTIYRDHSGNLWLGTRDKGLEKYLGLNDSGMPQFEHFFPKRSSPDRLWGEYVASVFEDSKKRFWVGTLGDGLNLYDREKRVFNHFKSQDQDSNSLSSSFITSIEEDRLGRIWIGSFGGLSLLKENSDGQISFQNFRYDPYNPQSLSLNAVFKVFEDSKGRIWIGINHGGLNLMHQKEDGSVWFEHLTHDPKDSTSLSNDEVFVIHEDSKGSLWVGTSDGGVNRLIERRDPQTGKITFQFKRYSEINGLSDNEVNAILEDNHGFLWIATNKGLSRFDPEKETFVNYTTYDGILKGKFRKNAAWRDKDGTMFFGGAAGVNVFNPEKFEMNQVVPQPQFVSILVDGKEVLLEDARGIQVNLNKEDGQMSLILPWSYNRFEVHFSAMIYASPLRNQYAYKLEGVDKKWHYYSGSDPKAVYSGLSPGNYIFSVKVANNDGQWNPESITLEVKVEGRTRASIFVIIGLIIVLFAGGITIYFKRKTLQIRKEKEFEKDEEFHKDIPQEWLPTVKKLEELMILEKLYLENKLGLQNLADRLNITSNQLSSLLNDYMGKSFYDYINEYRVEEVKRMLKDSAHKKKTILGIAWECGFNSKSAFNRIFKEATGFTPSQYQKESK